MQDYKVFVQRMGLTGFANIAVALSSIIIIPILTKNLTVNDYGVWVQFIATIGLLPFFTTLGLPYAMIRFLAASKDAKKIQEVYYSFFFVITLFTLLISFIIWIFSKQISSLLFGGNIEVLIFLPISIFLASIINLLINYFRTFQQFKLYSIFLVLQAYLNIVLVGYYIYSGYGIFGAFLGFLISQTIVFVLMQIIVVNKIRFKFPRFLNIYYYLKYSLPIIQSNISQWVVNAGDRYVIAILLGTSFVGFYSLGYTLANVLIMIFSPFSLLLPPLLSQKYDSRNFKEVKMYIEYSLKLFLVVAIPATFGLSILSKQLITILSTPELASQGYFITPFIAVSMLLWGIYAIIENILIVNKRTQIIGSIWIIAAIMNIVLNFILIPYMGILGAAISTLITFLFSSAFGMMYSFKYIKLRIDYIFILKTIFSSILMSLIIIFINPGNSYWIVTIIISIIIYIILLIILKTFKKSELLFLSKLIFHDKN